ncbi:hypothetical protein MTY414_54920 [Mycolicibacterium mageritense]|nr:hypothetical protein MTY414_54920 [Mycolicibacterium mageritense]
MQINERQFVPPHLATWQFTGNRNPVPPAVPTALGWALPETNHAGARTERAERTGRPVDRKNLTG